MVFDGRDLDVTISFEGIAWSVRFSGVHGIRLNSEPLCEAWHYELAYDRVSEVKSDWNLLWKSRVSVVNDAALPTLPVHFALALDSWGCLEVLADSASAQTFESLAPAPRTPDP